MKLLPYFPDSKYLEQKSYHRLAKVLAYILELYFIIYLGAQFILNTYNSIQFSASLDPNYYGSFWNEEIFLIVLIPPVILTLLGLFLFNISYRVFLYIVLGNKWKDKK